MKLLYTRDIFGIFHQDFLHIPPVLFRQYFERKRERKRGGEGEVGELKAQPCEREVLNVRAIL